MPTSSPSIFAHAFANPLADKTQVVRELIREMQEIGHDPFSLRPIKVPARNEDGGLWWLNYDFSHQSKNTEIPKLSREKIEEILKLQTPDFINTPRFAVQHAYKHGIELRQEA